MLVLGQKGDSVVKFFEVSEQRDRRKCSPLTARVGAPQHGQHSTMPAFVL